VSLGRFYWASLGLVLVALAIGAWGLVTVGADARVPIHWDAAGQPDGYAPAALSFLFMPVIMGALVALFVAIPRIEPRAGNLARSASAYQAISIAVLVLLTGIQAMIVLAGTGHPVDVNLVVGLGIGALFVVIGAVLGSVRSNFMVGVRTPWTLTSELSWQRTHRLTGRLFMGLGLILVVLAVVGRSEALFAVLIGGIVLILVVAFVYSYRVWRDDPDRQPRGA
jgi:uncharacterized membrane protein